MLNVGLIADTKNEIIQDVDLTEIPDCKMQKFDSGNRLFLIVIKLSEFVCGSCKK
jgi:hypothetical protein